MTNQAFRLSYVPAFDGLRGIAVLLVLAHHAAVPFLPGGFVAVDILFTLGGFLITSLLVREFDDEGRINLMRFYLRRALRLLPALVVLLTILNVVGRIVLPAEVAQDTARDSVFALLFAANWISAFSLASSRFLPHTWSLALQEQFYLLFPILLIELLRRVSRERVLRIIVSLGLGSWAWRLLLVVQGAAPQRVYYGLDTRLDSLMMGCAVALLLSTPLFGSLKHYAADHPLRIASLAGVATAALILIVLWAHAETPLTVSLLMPVVALLTAILIVSVVIVDTSWLHRVLAWRPLVVIGRLSYALYLWHMVFYRVIGIGSATELTLALSATALMAVLSYWGVEKPMLRFKSWVRDRGYVVQAA